MSDADQSRAGQTSSSYKCDPETVINGLETFIAEYSGQVAASEEHLTALTALQGELETAKESYQTAYDKLQKLCKESECDIDGYKTAAEKHLDCDAIKKCYYDYNEELKRLQEYLEKKKYEYQQCVKAAATAEKVLEEAKAGFDEAKQPVPDWSAQLKQLVEKLGKAQTDCDWCLLYALILEIETVCRQESVEDYYKRLVDWWCKVYEAQKDLRAKTGEADKCKSEMDQAAAALAEHQSTRWEIILECVRKISGCQAPETQEAGA